MSNGSRLRYTCAPEMKLHLGVQLDSCASFLTVEESYIHCVFMCGLSSVLCSDLNHFDMLLPKKHIKKQYKLLSTTPCCEYLTCTRTLISLLTLITVMIFVAYYILDNISNLLLLIISFGVCALFA